MLDPKLKRARDRARACKPYLDDNTQAWDMQPDGTFKRVKHGRKKAVNAQADLLKTLAGP